MVCLREAHTVEKNGDGMGLESLAAAVEIQAQESPHKQRLTNEEKSGCRGEKCKIVLRSYNAFKSNKKGKKGMLQTIAV